MFGFIFPGQGSQKIGMLAGMSARFPEIKHTFDEASTSLGYDLWDLTQHGSEERLNETICSQPAMLVAGIALWRTWLAAGGAKPSVVAGHSLGEYTALVAADAMVFSDAVLLVEERGRCMQEAMKKNEAGMVAVIGLSQEDVSQLCVICAKNDVLEIANINSPEQIVVSGHKEAIVRFIEAAKKKGSKRAVMLPLSVPSHCSLMRSAVRGFSEALGRIPLKLPTIPLLHNVHARECGTLIELKEVLIRQLYLSVQWVDTIATFEQRGVKMLVECGSGRVLSGLNRRNSTKIIATSLSEPTLFDEALALTAKTN